MNTIGNLIFEIERLSLPTTQYTNEDKIYEPNPKTLNFEFKMEILRKKDQLLNFAHDLIGQAKEESIEIFTYEYLEMMQSTPHDIEQREYSALIAMCIELQDRLKP